MHFAPEICLEYQFRKIKGKMYVTADLLDPRADVKADITNLQFNNCHFDIIYCLHVLEHIPDDRKAMQELFQALTIKGVAIIMVPLRGKKTKEDLSINDPKERAQRYGQADHVRHYGMDIINRLKSVGFSVQCIHTDSLFSTQEIELMRLSHEYIFICRK